MNFKKTSRKLMSFVLAGCLSYSIVAPAITPAQASEMSYSVMITPQYEDADSFSEGLAAVKKDGKWGYIDETGKTVIPFEYDYAFPFSEGLAVVAKYGTSHLDEKYTEHNIAGDDCYYWYVIDSKNNKKLLTYPSSTYNYETKESIDFEQPVYTFVEVMEEILTYAMVPPEYHNGYLVMNAYLSEAWSSLIFDKNGDYYKQVNNSSSVKDSALLPYYKFNENSFVFADSYEGKVCYIDANGNIALTIGGNGKHITGAYPFNQGIAVYYDKDVDSYGFIDKSGNIIISPQYDSFYYSTDNFQVFVDNIASVENKNGIYGGIDKTGKTVIPFEYQVLKNFHEGLAVAQKNGKYGVIDTNNNVIVPFEYDNLSGYSDGVCVAVQNGNAFCIDRYGNKINGSDKINQESYFDSSDAGTISVTPDEIIVIKENGVYGFAKTIFTPDLPQKSEMDSWAYDEVVKSIEADLIPVSLQNQYKTNISRSDFAALVVTLLEQASGKDINTLVKEETGKTISELVKSYPFTDTTSSDVLAANALGIISGRGNGIFDPYASITRQEAAALLMRIGKYMGKTDVETSSASFTDSSAIQSYAIEAVNYVNSLGVMKGTSDTTFSPNGTYTRQQAYITALRLYNAISE